MQIDLATRFLGAGHQIFIIHPGERKKFYDEVRARSKIFLDIPGAKLLKDADYYSVATISQLMIGQAVSRWHLRGTETEEPSRDPADYAKRARRFLAKRGSSKRFARLVTQAQGLYKEAAAGDLVVVPGGGYMSEVLIGEIVGDFNGSTSAASNLYPGEAIPARAIKWLSTDQKKVEFTEELIRLMQNMSAVIRLSPPNLKEEIYRLAYGQYAFEDETILEIKVNSPSVDFKDLVDSSRLALYFAALHSAYAKGKLDEFLAIKDRDEATKTFYDKELYGDVSVEINSPGVIYLVAKTAAAAVIIGSLLALSASQYVPNAQGDPIVVTNSAQTTPSCEIPVQDELKKIFAHFGKDRWEKLCKERDKATDTTGLDTGVQLIPTPKPQKKKP